MYMHTLQERVYVSGADVTLRGIPNYRTMYRDHGTFIGRRTNSDGVSRLVYVTYQRRDNYDGWYYSVCDPDHSWEGDPHDADFDIEWAGNLQRVAACLCDCDDWANIATSMDELLTRFPLLTRETYHGRVERNRAFSRRLCKTHPFKCREF